jgi:hypothetical protein
MGRKWIDAKEACLGRIRSARFRCVPFPFQPAPWPYMGCVPFPFQPAPWPDWDACLFPFQPMPWPVLGNVFLFWVTVIHSHPSARIGQNPPVWGDSDPITTSPPPSFLGGISVPFQIALFYFWDKLLAMPMAWVARMLTPPTFSIGLSLLGALPPNPLFT